MELIRLPSSRDPSSTTPEVIAAKNSHAAEQMISALLRHAPQALAEMSVGGVREKFKAQSDSLQWYENILESTLSREGRKSEDFPWVQGLAGK